MRLVRAFDDATTDGWGEGRRRAMDGDADAMRGISHPRTASGLRGRLRHRRRGRRVGALVLLHRARERARAAVCRSVGGGRRFLVESGRVADRPVLLCVPVRPVTFPPISRHKDGHGAGRDAKSRAVLARRAVDASTASTLAKRSGRIANAGARGETRVGTRTRVVDRRSRNTTETATAEDSAAGRATSDASTEGGPRRRRAPRAMIPSTSYGMDDKENAARAGVYRPPSKASSASSSSSSSSAFVSTSRATRPALGRDVAPTLLRLGRPDDVPLLRFDDAAVGRVKTLPLRISNDTPSRADASFVGIPRDEGFLIDPDRVSVPAGGSELVRVSWCPPRATASAYCGIVKVVFDGGAGGTAAAAKIRLRGGAVARGGGGGGERETTTTAGKYSYTYNPRRSSASGGGGGVLGTLNGNSASLVRVGGRARSRRGSDVSTSSAGKRASGGKRARAERDSVGDASCTWIGNVAFASAWDGDGDGDGDGDDAGGVNATARKRVKPFGVPAVSKALSLRKPPRHRAGKSPKPSSSSRARRLKTDAAADAAADARVPRPNFEAFHSQFWVRQQERAFTDWLNRAIAPAAGDDDDDEAAREEGGSSRAAKARRLDAAARARLWRLYSEDAEVQDVILRAEAHVDDGKLRLRGTVGSAREEAVALANGAGKDGGSFMEDVRLRREFKDALGCYSLFWLRAVVDTILGNPGDLDLGHGEREDERVDAFGRRRTERAALVDALLRDRELEMEFGVGGVGAPPFAEGYHEILASTVLKRTLLLTFLLDRAQAGLDPSTPLLFRSRAPIKSSAAVARAALQASCHGEGDVLRHLKHLGYVLHHAQEPIREYDFKTTRLAVDLRDGVRLCRLVENMSERRGDDGVMRRVKFPAESRAAKAHNVRAALDTAASCGVALDTNPEDIVDGHLANTLGLLYGLMMHFQAPGMLPGSVLENEIAEWKERRRAQIMAGKEHRGFHRDTLAPAASSRYDDAANEEDVSPEEEERRTRAVFEEELADARVGVETASLSAGHETMLLRWARAVCANYGVAITDATTSFADGRALCALVHAYAPELLPLGLVKNPPAGFDPSAAPTAWASARPDNPARGVTRDAIVATAACEHNFDIVRGLCAALGDVPEPTFGPADVARGGGGGPDGKVVAGYLLFLCARLLGHRTEGAAARKVQRAWRWTHWAPGTLHRWVAAQMVVAKRWRGFAGRKEAKARSRAVVATQAAWRGRDARLWKRHKIQAAVMIQKIARGWLLRLRNDDVLWATIAAQTARRGAVARRRFAAVKRATVTIQAHWKRSQRRSFFLEWKWESAAATVIQANVRAWSGRRAFINARIAAVTIQAWTRGTFWRRVWGKYKSRLAATISLQKNARMFLAKCEANRRRKAIQDAEDLKRHDAAIRIQKHFRGYWAFENWLDVKCVTIMCQAYCRGGRQRRAYLALKRAAITTQRFRRGKIARDARTRAVDAATTIQAHFRGWQARADYADAWYAAATIQASWRGCRDRVAYASLLDAMRRREHHAAVVIQKHVRRLIARLDYAEAVYSATVIQSWTRTFLARRAFKASAAANKAEDAARCIQRHVRGWIAREDYLDVLCAVVTFQAYRRGVIARHLARKLRHERAATAAATAVQAAWRGKRARDAIAFLRAAEEAEHRAAAITIQTKFRAWMHYMDYAFLRYYAAVCQRRARAAAERRRFLATRAAAVTCQKYARGAAARRAYHAAQLAELEDLAAVIVQAATRGWLVRRFVKRNVAAEVITRLARGFLTRIARDAAQPAMAELRSRVIASRARAKIHPHLRIGLKTVAAVATLHAPKKLREVKEALSDLARATRWSSVCRDVASSPRALQALFRTIRQCDRGANHESVLSSAYDLLENLSADENGPARAVFEARDSITVITEHMQMCRDRPLLVAAATRTVCNLTRDSSRALVVACAGKTLCRIRSISEIMSNTLGTHRHRRLTYIEQQRPDKAREEANAMNALELSIRSVGALIAHLEPFAMKVAGRPPATRSKSRLSERMSTGGRSARSAR